MTLQMHYQEKFEQGLEEGLERGLERGREEEREQSKRQFALRMIQDGELSLEKIAAYSGLTVDEVLGLEKEEAAQLV